MLQIRKQFAAVLLISAYCLLINPIGATNRLNTNASDAEFLTIIVDETMRNLLKQCNGSVSTEDYRSNELAPDQLSPAMMKQLSDLMGRTVRSLSDSFTTRLLQRFPKNCADILPSGVRDRDGVYSLHISSYMPINVYCFADAAGGCPWTIVHRRQDKDTAFNLNWAYYKAGFGDPYNSFFVGMEPLYWLTSDAPHELRIVMRLNSESVEEIAHYDHFSLGDEKAQYALKVGQFSGNAADELTPLNGYKFRTKDRTGYCKGKEKDGGWWKEGCARSKLNGIYEPTQWEIPQHVGITWNNRTTHGFNYSLEYVHMAIRPKFCNKIHL
ncbi:angiopoietin-4-like [Anastrepha obliqua]|uniref:angiopoietin-4-like n=1 Tax=Anastrepha obliqua TaxID=95512 RepID=UPI00240A16D5|nr:angiopoietin-4-like [Anastrepha obliqua]